MTGAGKVQGHAALDGVWLGSHAAAASACHRYRCCCQSELPRGNVRLAAPSVCVCRCAELFPALDSSSLVQKSEVRLGQYSGCSGSPIRAAGAAARQLSGVPAISASGSACLLESPPPLSCQPAPPLLNLQGPTDVMSAAFLAAYDVEEVPDAPPSQVHARLGAGGVVWPAV